MATPNALTISKPVKPVVALPRWTNAYKAALRTYLTEIQRLMHLTDWEIILDWEPASDDACATISPAYGQKRAVLNLAKDFLSEEPAHQRHTLCHELVHCHLAAMADLVRTTNEAVLSKQALQVAQAGVYQAAEYTTDALADALAPFLPLPTWPQVTVRLSKKTPALNPVPVSK